MTVDDLRASVATLLEQGAYADESIARACEEPVNLRTAHYAGTRNVILGTRTVAMFAVAVKGKRGDRDVAYMRTPELAKFVAQLVILGDEVFPLIRATLEVEG